MLPLAAKLAIVFVAGACLGSLVNWAIYSLAWFPRPISPWSGPHPDAPPRRARDRVPIFGWVTLNREAPLHGPRYWFRPMLLEIGLGAAFAALYYWEISLQGLLHAQSPVPLASPLAAFHWHFAAHVVLICLMLATSFIDIDEKLVPDEITVIGTLAGLVLATLVPLSMLPNVEEHVAPPMVGVALMDAKGVPAVGFNGEPLWLEPVLAVAPRLWPPNWGRPRDIRSLAVGLGCYLLWCFALAPRRWRGRRGVMTALALIFRRVGREFARPPLLWLLILGVLGIATVWWFGESSWAGLLTALVGVVGGGGIVWAVRLIGTFALRREAMGFGDVTFMMMVGAFLGWQACIILFFLSPFAAIIVGLTQFLLKKDDQIPFVPYLALAAVATILAWASIWDWAEPIFGVGWLVPGMLAICLTMLGILLGIWQMIKTFIFGGAR